MIDTPSSAEFRLSLARERMAQIGTELQRGRHPGPVRRSVGNGLIRLGVLLRGTPTPAAQTAGRFADDASAFTAAASS